MHSSYARRDSAGAPPFAGFKGWGCKFLAGRERVCEGPKIRPRDGELHVESLPRWKSLKKLPLMSPRPERLRPVARSQRESGMVSS